MFLSKTRRRLGHLWLLAAAIGLTAEAADPAALLAEIRAGGLDTDRAVTLRNVAIQVGEATLDVSSGLLVPSRPVAGRRVELVFVGQARFRVAPPDATEAGQLELFTGQRSLDTPVEEAVLVAVHPETVDRLLDRPTPHELRPALIERVQAVHQRWNERVLRRAAAIEAGVFKALLGDVAFRDYFALWCRSHELGDFVYQLDPEDVESLTLAAFIPSGVSGWERLRLQRHIRLQQRKDRWLGVHVDDLGSWDVWMSMPFEDDGKPRYPGNTGFEAEHYELDVRIARRGLRLEGLARIDLVAQSDGRRTATLDLFRDLQVQRVIDRAGRELFHFRSGHEVVVVLPEPSTAGEKLQLTVEYGGRVLKWVDDRTFDLEDTKTWYPHCGTVDRATYDVTLRWPRKYELHSSGRRENGGVEGRYRWERRVLEQPAIAFSFVMGDFVVDRVQAGHVELTVAFTRASPIRLTEDVRRPVVEAISESLQYFEEVYGPYPLDHLTVVTLPRGGLPVRYSQSYLGYITLTDTVTIDADGFALADVDWFRSTTVAHEVAHQWWGNLLGWWSYRDQWLSEAMANYSALQYYAHAEGKDNTFLAQMSSGWRQSLSRTTLEGRPVESLGPIVLGARLNSSLAGNGYRAIVYRKGAVVLAMLARAVGEERFLEMLRSLVEVAVGRVLTTEGFLEALERMSALELDGFARQFIYGTGIPEVYYAYDIVPDGSEWRVQGEARRLGVPRFQHRLTRGEQHGWDLLRQGSPRPVDESAALMVPFHVEIEAATSASRTRRPTTPVRSGRLFLEGSRDEFTIETAQRPLSLRLDPRGEILARFYSAERNPKRVARYRADDDALAGRPEQAEAGYRRALELDLGARGERAAYSWMSDPRREVQEADAEIRLALARIYLDQRRDEEAEAELDIVEELMAPARQIFRVERDVLRSRLDLRRGEFLPAFRRLKKTLRMADPPDGPRGWRSLLWSLQLSSERLAVPEAYALLAVAAHETGNRAELGWALEQAEERGIDMTVLRARLGTEASR